MEKKLVAAGIKVINPKYSQELIAITDNSYSVIIGQLNKRKINIAIIISLILDIFNNIKKYINN
jgi:hypothetical protein